MSRTTRMKSPISSLLDEERHFWAAESEYQRNMVASQVYQPPRSRPILARHGNDRTGVHKHIRKLENEITSLVKERGNMKMESLMQARHERYVAAHPLMITPETAADMRPELATLCGDDDKATIRKLRRQVSDLKRIQARDYGASKLHRAFMFMEQEPSEQRDRFVQYQRGSSHLQSTPALPLTDTQEDRYKDNYAPFEGNREIFFDEELRARFESQRTELELEKREANDMQHGFETLELANEKLQTRLNVAEETIAELRERLAGCEQARGHGVRDVLEGEEEEGEEEEEEEWSDLEGEEIESEDGYMYGDAVQAFDIYGDL